MIFSICVNLTKYYTCYYIVQYFNQKLINNMTKEQTKETDVEESDKHCPSIKVKTGGTFMKFSTRFKLSFTIFKNIDVFTAIWRKGISTLIDSVVANDPIPDVTQKFH